MQTTYPELKDRIQSTFIDTFFLLGLMFLFASLLDKFEYVPDWVRILIFVGLFVAYEPICMSVGFTLGNYLKGIRVRNDTDTTKGINFFQALVRYLIKLLLGWISFLTIHSNPRRRAIHDVVSGTVMIKL
jgi:uncharacterized RDD family membrane protein YckC